MDRGGFAAIPRLFQRPPGNSRFAEFLPDPEVIQRAEIAESPVKRAFRGVCPHPFYYWFSPRAILGTPRQRRVETLQSLFADGFGGFDTITRASTIPRRVAARFVKLFVRHPSMAWLSDAFFRFVYYPLTGARDAIHK